MLGIGFIASQLSPHLLDRPPQATPQRHRPEIFRRAQCLVPVLRGDLDTLPAAAVRELADRLRRPDAVPGVKSGIQMRSRRLSTTP